MHTGVVTNWRSATVGCTVAAALVFDPRCAQANAGVPLIFVTLPGMALALVPVVVVESFVLARRLKVDWWSCANSSVVANLASSFLGIPATWLLLAVVQMVSGGGEAFSLASRWHHLLAISWQAPWLIPYENDLWWMVPSAMLVLLIPFFFTSVVIEYYVVRRMLPASDHSVVRGGVLLANTWSYAGLAVVLLMVLALAKPQTNGI